MRTNDKTHNEMLTKLRKMTATKVAEQIAKIQPLDGKDGRIFAPHIPGIAWTKWRKTISIWPRRSINGKIIFGRINKRSKPNYNPIIRNNRRSRVRDRRSRVKEFATNKELFHQKLKNGKT